MPRNNYNPKREKPEFEQKMVDLARVTRVTKGGKQMNFRALMVIGDKKGKVGYGVAKGKDVTLAISKAVEQAKKKLEKITLHNGTIPHRIEEKYKAARILLKPAPKGTGIIAGGAVRAVLDLAGVSNVVAKILGTNNKINNVKASIEALRMLKRIEPKKTETKNNKEGE